MYLSELMTMDKKKLNKMKKDDIVKVLIESKWQWDSKDTSLKEAKENNAKSAVDAILCKNLIVAYLGKEVERDEYSGEIKNIKTMPIVELVGELLGKVSKT